MNSRPDTVGARTVMVETLRSEARLRNLAWIESNRQRVHKATNGRVGYVYVPSTGIDGQNDLARMFYGQASMDAMIIDERSCIRCGLCVDWCPTECLTMDHFRMTPAEERELAREIFRELIAEYREITRTPRYPFTRVLYGTGRFPDNIEQLGFAARERQVHGLVAGEVEEHVQLVAGLAAHEFRYVRVFLLWHDG